MNPLFQSLVIGLAHQADQALQGTLPAAVPGAPEPREVARALIDTLGMLEQKTAGQLDPEEQKLLSEVVTSLRFRFVATEKK